MAIGTRKILANTEITVVDGEAIYATSYRLTTPAENNHETGLVTTPVSSLTESTFNLQVQQAVADRANLEAAETEFNSSHVYGGRI